MTHYPFHTKIDTSFLLYLGKSDRETCINVSQDYLRLPEL